MKPKINDKKCGGMDTCKLIKLCPTEAISYIKAEDLTPANCGCDCDCEPGYCENATVGKIVIDYDKCTECGVCSSECCASAIDMV